ncbi:MAG: flagellar basal body L-ring protein FlgH [Pseudomonadota bacterium]
MVFISVTAVWMVGVGTPLLAETLYSENSYRPLASDKRAHLLGDVLTVMIYENSSAATSADTTLQRNSDLGLQAGANQITHNASLGVNNHFDGGGTIQRTGKMLAQMTVSVRSVASNGDLWVTGEQLLEINEEKQKIKVEGRVRPLDISDTNTVFSYRLADAKISYLNDGDLATHQRLGFWSRLFTWVGF